MITEAKEGEESERTRKTLASSSLYAVMGLWHRDAPSSRPEAEYPNEVISSDEVERCDPPDTHTRTHTSETHTDKPHLLIYQRESHSNQGGPKSLKHNKTDLVLIKPKYNHRFPLSRTHRHYHLISFSPLNLFCSAVPSLRSFETIICANLTLFIQAERLCICRYVCFYRFNPLCGSLLLNN